MDTEALEKLIRMTIQNKNVLITPRSDIPCIGLSNLSKIMRQLPEKLLLRGLLLLQNLSIAGKQSSHIWSLRPCCVGWGSMLHQLLLLMMMEICGILETPMVAQTIGHIPSFTAMTSHGDSTKGNAWSAAIKATNYDEAPNPEGSFFFGKRFRLLACHTSCQIAIGD